MQPLELPEDDRTAEVTSFVEGARWTGLTDQQYQAWALARKSIVTASRVPALLGLSPFEDEIDVYVDMVTPANEPEHDVDHGLNDPRTWGRALERAVAETASKYYGWELRMSGALLVSRKHPTIGATLDAEVREGDEWILYEGKTTAAWRARDWDEETGAAPDHVFVQAHTQLLVTGAPRGFICCLIGGNRFSKIELHPSDALQALIIETVEVFLERVQKLDPPPPTYRSRDAIAQLYPGDDGSSIALPSECVEYTREIQEIAARTAADEQRAEELKNKIRLSIGSATYGVLPEEVGGKGRWKNAFEQKSRVLRCVKAEPVKALRGGRPRLALVERTERTVLPAESAGMAGPIRFRGRRRATR